MELLAEFKTPRAPATAPGAVVLRKREDEGALHPYVTDPHNQKGVDE